MQRATDWSQIPILLTVADLREKFGLSRQASYTLAHVLGLKVGKRLVVPKAAVQNWIERQEEEHEASRTGAGAP